MASYSKDVTHVRLAAFGNARFPGAARDSTESGVSPIAASRGVPVRLRRAALSDGGSGVRDLSRMLPGAPVVAALLIATQSPVLADEGERNGQRGQKPSEQSLWQRLATPHAQEIQVILTHGRTLYERALGPTYHPDDEDLRRRLLADAHGMLRHARKLAPHNLEVIELLAYVDDASGNVGDALTGYRTYVAGKKADRIPLGLCLKFGALLARAEQSAEAIDRLRQCADVPLPLRDEDSRQKQSQALLLLSMLYIHSDQIDEGIDVLLRRSESMSDSTVYFALAVAYDKDEQVTRAYEILDRKLGAMAEDLIFSTVAERLLEQTFAPAVERHYYFALLYESRGLFPEARHEWHTYVRSGERARFRKRAQKHIRAIDDLVQRQRRRRAKAERIRP
ncbi:MAG: hypothetical protein MJE77_11215 [Proteobacteria bacterium]|nr:hypothetical protein [Pseudomonadota bacterium]